MSVGEYVSVKIPSSNKIVAGLVEELNGNEAVVRLRSAPDAKSHNRDETITVPVSNLQSLGVSSPATRDELGAFPASPQSGKDHLSPGGSSSDYTGRSEDITDPFKNFDDGGSLSSSVTVLTAESSAELKEKKRNEATATVFRHGIFSQYVWEFFSPIAALLRCERPLFSIAFIILFVLADLCRTSPERVVETTCYVVSRIIRDESGRSLPVPASSLSFASLTGVGETSASSKREEDNSLKREFEKTIGNKQEKQQEEEQQQKQKKEKNSSSKKKNGKNKKRKNAEEETNKKANNNNQQQQQQQQQKDSASSSPTNNNNNNIIPFQEHLPKSVISFLLAVDKQIEETIIFRTRLFIRDAGLFMEDFWIAGERYVLANPATQISAASTLRGSSRLGQVCAAIKKDPSNALSYSGGAKDSALIVAHRISCFIYAVLLCMLWSQGIRCASPSNDNNNNKIVTGIASTSARNKTPEEIASELEIEEENRLLDDAEDGFEEQDEENDDQAIRFQLKTEKLEYRRRHEKMKKLELEIHYPDLAVRKFLKEFQKPIVLHLIIICIICVANWMFRVVPVTAITGSPPTYRVVYSHPFIKDVLSPLEESLVEICAPMLNQTLESWLVQSFTINVLLGVLGYVVGMKWRK